jgi:hypothetical protein
MPKIYVAEEKADSPKKIASGSMTTMKERLRAFPDSLWSIKTVQVKADVPTLCSLIEGAEMPVESSEDVRVNASGQVRAAK